MLISQTPGWFEAFDCWPRCQMVSDLKAVSLPSLINMPYVSSLSVCLFKWDSNERTGFILKNAHLRLAHFLWEGLLKGQERASSSTIHLCHFYFYLKQLEEKQEKSLAWIRYTQCREPPLLIWTVQLKDIHVLCTLRCIQPLMQHQMQIPTYGACHLKVLSHDVLRRRVIEIQALNKWIGNSTVELC